MNKNLWIVLGCLVVFGLVAVIMTKLAKWNYSSFEKADAVADKIAKVFGGDNKPKWFAGVVILEDEKYGYIVELRMFSETWELTPDQIVSFPSNRELNGVQIRLRLMEGGMPVVQTKKTDK